MADGSITFDTSVDPSGVNKAGSLISKSFRSITARISTAFRGVGTTAKTQFQKIGQQAKTVFTGIGMTIRNIGAFSIGFLWGFASRLFAMLAKRLAQFMGDLIRSNEQAAASIGRIKGNLLTAFQPLWEAALPVILKILAALERATALAAQFSAAVFGKSTAAMAKNAKALHTQAKATKEVGDAAEDASKSLAGFDTINQLGSDEKKSSKTSADKDSGGIAADFSGAEDLSELDAKTAKIMTYGTLILGTALLLIGIARVNIPLMITGALMIKAGLQIGQNTGAFDGVPPWVHQIITWGMTILGTVLMVVGIATLNITMLLSGIALMAVGYAYGSATGAFDAVPQWVNDIITWGGLILGTVLVIVGIATVNIPLIIAGLALIGVAVAYGSKTGVFADTSDALKEFGANVSAWCSASWARITTWFRTNVKPIFTKEWWKNHFEQIRAGAHEKFEEIKTTVSTKAHEIKESALQKWNELKTGASNVWNNIKLGISTACTNAKDGMVNSFTSAKQKIGEVFDGIWAKIKAVINSILGGIERMVNGVINGINSMIRAINSLSFEIPDWVPKYGGARLGFDIQEIANVQLPRLASGTVVPANYGEFAAILGDNRREPEVVSPISAIKQAVREVLAELGGAGGIRNITLTIAERVISEAVIEYINGKREQLGVSVIKV